MIKKKHPLKIILKILGTILVIILVILLILAAVFPRKALWSAKFVKNMTFLHNNDSSKYNTVDATLTMEQRLSDFDYMYDRVCLQNPEKEYLEQQFGISYEEIYDRYRQKVLETTDEYEYYSLLTCFLSLLPGQHNCMSLPDYDSQVVNGDFALLERLWTEDIKDHINSYRDAFHDKVLSYDQRALVFGYSDGAYFAGPTSLCENMEEYDKARLLTLNGKNIDEMVFDIYERYVPTYDSEYEKFFRTNLIFNESTGEKYTAELEMPDGKIVTVDLYDDPGYDLAIVDRGKVYKDTADKPEDDASADENTDSETNEPSKPISYYFAEDPERKLVYIRHNTCLASESEQLANDIRTALQNVNAEYVILDLRANKGGASTVVTQYLCPELFRDDLPFKQNLILPDNELTEHFSSSVINSFSGLGDFKKENGYITYTEDFSVDGKAEKEYKIYVLVSPVTFSSGDIMARIAKEYDNATVIGTNTGGEGISGTLFNDYLPESRFIFSYAPSLNKDHPEDSVYGTEPDIHMHNTKEASDKYDEIEAQGVDPATYEGRQLWDMVLINTLEIIDAE